MVYGENILPVDAARYELYKAHIDNGDFVIDAGGHVKCTLTKEDIGSLSEFFKVNVSLEPASDAYDPGTHIRLCVESENEWLHHTIFPTTELSSTEIRFDRAAYEQMFFEVYSDTNVRFSLCEVCPESSGDTEVIIDGVKQSLPRLLYDYNNTDIVVEQPEQVVAMINCYLKDGTDLQGHFLMNFTASEFSTVHLRFFDNDMIELFSPIVHTVNNGYNTIEVPHAYLAKDIGVHNFYVTAQVTNGRLLVPIRSVLYTIDGGYLAERLTNPGMDVCDVSVKQLSTDNSPSELWAIGLDNGKVFLKKRAFDATKPNVAWDAVGTLGDGLAAAVEFNGVWARPERDAVYTLYTEDFPFVAVVDNRHMLKLYQHGLDEPPMIVDTNVSTVSMVRGYKSETFLDQDQGLILAWVKDGNVYYEQFAMFNGSCQWLPIEQLTTSGDVSHVQVHRLNDYRVGFVVQSANENIWYISERTYVSQAVPTELLNAFCLGYQGACWLTQEEVDSISFEAIPEDLGDVTHPHDSFYIDFVYPSRISLLEGDEDLWKYDVDVYINDLEVRKDDFDITIEGKRIAFTLAEPVWGQVKVHWKGVYILFEIEPGRTLINTQEEYTFTWNVWHSLSHLQPPEKVSAKLAGDVTFQYLGLNKSKANYQDRLAAEMAGKMTFVCQPIARPAAEYADAAKAAMQGTVTFTDEQVGEQPI